MLDTAGRLLVIRTGTDHSLQREETALPEADLPQRVAQIASLGVEVLICGAVSRVMEEMLAQRGIQIIPHICGDVEEVLSCYLAGETPQSRFGMPGCCGRRRRRGQHGRRCRNG